MYHHAVFVFEINYRKNNCYIKFNLSCHTIIGSLYYHNDFFFLIFSPEAIQQHKIAVYIIIFFIFIF